MSYVAIVKTAKDHKPWKGLPDNYPVRCQEYDTLSEAGDAHPNCTILTIEQYRAFSAALHDLHPSPHKHVAHLIPIKQKRPWWAWFFFWRSR